MTTQIAVTWVSFNHDPFERGKDGAYIEHNGERRPGPTLEMLFNRGSPVFGSIEKLYVFARYPSVPERDERRVHPREADVVAELRAAIEGHNAPPKIEVIRWETDFPPTDHRALFSFTANALVRIKKAHPRARIVVNLSPGTPAMQTVLLLALQARLAGEDVKAFQGVPRDKRRSATDVMREVPWNLLAELAATAPIESANRGKAADWKIERAKSKRLRDVATAIERFGGVPYPVLIIGARGTGKTVVAYRLRDEYRKWKVKASTNWEFHLNCAEFRGDPNMLRSALFGHMKGVHSTAHRDEPGLLERATDDCVFLDEIHWMDPQAQGLLLLALQRNGSMRRIGAERVIQARFRLIAATNQRIEDLREKLPPDFLDRISDLVIELPELQDCRDDLSDVWISVVRAACRELHDRDSERAVAGGPLGTVESLVAEFDAHHDRITQTLVDLRLPGNFRDLERLARRLLVAGLTRGRYLALNGDIVGAELEQMQRDERGDAARGRFDGHGLLDELPTIARCEEHLRRARADETTISAQHAISEWERRLLFAARKVAGSGSKAAALLGLPPRTFNGKLEKWSEPT